ncbi:MAG: HAMP domain-containing sensor histidine kinase, partial [Candidatus Brocadiia bacterium]|nr:HAMP domain-containing sensor histidine kinase [Candidatus Brocadiia bacterium]
TTDGAKLEAGAAWEKSRTIAWCTLAVGLAFGALTVFLTHRAIIRPINEIVDGTRALAGGDLTKRLSTPAVAEFRQLAESFNRMAEALQAHQRQLVESEKLATVGRFAAGVAHEINNPIAVILGYAKTLIGRQPPDERVREGLVAIEEEACHCEKIVSELLDFSRPAGEPDEEPVNPARVTAEVVEMARVLRIVGQTRVEVNVVDRPLALGMGRAGLRQIILNFVTNAFEALREVDGAELHIEGRVEPPQAGPEAPNPGQAAGPTFVLRFADNGPGIPEAHRDKLFEPFFTTKSEGTGLGLAITYAIAEAHGGQIQVEPGEEAGTTFIVRLPVQPSVGG